MKRPAIIDANLCVLLVVGSADPEQIATHNRLDHFDKQDFFILRSLLDAYSGLLCLPNVVTETSNLVRHTGEPFRSVASRKLATLISAMDEVYVESRQAIEQPEYLRLGITDAALMILAQSGGTLLTVDLGLYVAATSASLSSVNYNHIKEQRPDFK